MAAGPDDSETLGERLLLANGAVRVWQDSLAPGEEQRLHTHRRPYLSVVVRGAHGEVVDSGGRVRYPVDRAPGAVTFFGPEQLPTTHALRNTGSEQLEVVVIELLDPSRSGAGAPGERAARLLGLSVAAGRAGLGTAALLAPRLLARPWVGEQPGPAGRVLGRALGGRDLALGLGALLAARRPEAIRRWVAAGALADLADAVATGADFRQLPARGRWLVLGAAGGAAVVGAVAARRL